MKNMNKRIALMIAVNVILSFFGTGLSAAEDAELENIFREGNAYYEKAEYQKAIAEYRKIVSRGYESGPLYYNLANAYFKSGELGKAMLNYKRAAGIMPRDADLRANYRFARAMVRGKPVPEKTITAWRPVRIFASHFTVDELTWMASALYLFILVFLALAVIRPGTGRYFVSASVVLFVLMVLTVLVVWKKAEYRNNGAVVVVPEANALFGPFDSATKFFSLHEGAPVTVLAEKDEWCKIKRPDGNVGWVKKGEVERMMGDGNKG